MRLRKFETYLIMYYCKEFSIFCLKSTFVIGYFTRLLIFKTIFIDCDFMLIFEGQVTKNENNNYKYMNDVTIQWVLRGILVMAVCMWIDVKRKLECLFPSNIFSIISFCIFWRTVIDFSLIILFSSNHARTVFKTLTALLFIIECKCVMFW